MTNTSTPPSHRTRPRRGRLLIAGLVAVATTAGGAAGGRALRSDDGADASLPKATAIEPSNTITAPDGSTIEMAPQEPLPEGYTVTPQEYLGEGDGAGSGSGATATPGAAPATGSGTPEANPGGAPDLAADPEAGIAGTPPTAGAPPEDPDYTDAAALAAVTTLYAEYPAEGTPPLALVPSAAPTPAFNDPCARNPSADGCVRGVSAIVLGDLPLPEVKTLWFGQVRQSDPYAAECSRQFPTVAVDWRNDTMFAVVLNQPAVAQLRLQLNTPGVLGSAIRISRPGELITVNAAPSADIVEAWGTAYAAGAATPGVPLCVKLGQATMDTNRDGCLGEIVGWGFSPCQTTFRLTYQTGCVTPTIEPLCSALTSALGTTQRLPIVLKGPYAAFYNYDPQWACDSQFGCESGLTQDTIRRQVQLVGIDRLNLEVRIPTFTITLAESTEEIVGGEFSSRAQLQQHQLVAAAGYAPGTDCRTVDPTVLSTTLPVTRQTSRTRYWTPDAGTPESREAVVDLTMPALAQGEAIDICVFWYLLADRSYDRPVVTSIERHTVVPPSRAATELTFVQVGRGGGLFSLPHASSPDAATTDLPNWTFQIIGERDLTNRCGFGAPALAELRPLGQPGFLCRIDSSQFVYDPADIQLYAGEPIEGGARGRVRINIDNRGCSPDGCGNTRVARIELSDGRWMDIAVRKVPLAVTAMLPNGRIVPGWSADQWLIDPNGSTSVAPQLRTPTAPSDPRLDTFGVRVRPNAADPSGSLDVTWQADRAVTMEASASVTNPGRYMQQCTQRFGPSNTPAGAGVTTIPGLCPNTEYAIQLTLRDASGRESVYRWTEGGARVDSVWSGLMFNLVGRTAIRPIPADALFEWSLAIGSVDGTVNFDTVISDLQVRLGNQTLVNRVDTPGSCTRVSPSTPTAAGFLGGVLIGETIIHVNYTLTTPGGPGCRGDATTSSFTGDIHVNWDGSEQTFQIDSGRSIVFLMLKPSAD